MKLKNRMILTVVVIIVTVIMFVVDVVWLYMKLFVDPPTTGAYTYVYTLTDGDEEAYFIEINHYSAADGVGEEMSEVIFNYYGDYAMGYIRSYGIQKIGGKYYYYDGFNGASWSGITQKDENFKMIVDIRDEEDIEAGRKGEPYAVVLDGTYKREDRTVNILKPVINIVKGVFGYIGNIAEEAQGKEKTSDWKYEDNGDSIWKDPFTDVTVHSVPYTFQDFLDAAVYNLTRSTYGFGEYVLPLVELQSYFSLQPFRDGQFVDGEQTTFSVANFAVKVNNHKSGVSYASQSSFGVVAGDPNFNVTGVAVEKDYWKVRVERTLTAEDFNYIYSPEFGGYLIDLPQSLIAAFAEYPSLTANIELDLSDKYLTDRAMDVVGVAEYGMFGLRVRTFKIIGYNGHIFRMLPHSMRDTYLENFAPSSYVVVDYAENWINTEVGLL
jgi:hypothetical protein